MIHAIGGNIDVCAWRRGKVVETEVNAFLPGLLPLAGRAIPGGDDGLRFGHGEDRSYTFQRGKAKVPRRYATTNSQFPSIRNASAARSASSLRPYCVAE